MIELVNKKIKKLQELLVMKIMLNKNYYYRKKKKI